MEERTGGRRGYTSKAERYRRGIGRLLAALVLLAGFSAPVQQIAALPEQVSIAQGSALALSLPFPLQAQADGACLQVASAQEGVASIGGEVLRLQGQSEGSARVTLRLMGIVPVKSMNVSVKEEKMLIPGGSLIGVAIKTQGVLLVGTSDVGAQESPARAAGLRAGDSILALNGQEVQGAEDLTAQIAISEGEPLRLTISRAGENYSALVTPVRDERDGIWRLGAWVRDSTAGVGTLSFIDPETGRYGALGHSISDIDTQTRMLLSEGAIYDGAVADVRRGAPGAPGELVGSFYGEKSSLGSIDRNTDFGIYGRYDSAPQGKAVPVMPRGQVRTGPALIISQVDNGPPRAYACEITRVMRQDAPAQRGLVVQVTDAELLAKTGGIVQGMSGSPIIQDGKLVGAVTHV
ncbi:MAG: SpoIVB peptidase, partial [Eubacteriales bacterium]|nr:SpoIVB peptidase [Eubacteriales bacterium]